ncbi:MAG: MBL fold metallo-hydrolase [Candidatus Methylacidiphilales bacterium]|nr:MBL fold metallo-hydrolase [Candidatus Methylacidiphilales bacterium]
MLSFTILASGSSGNCAFLETENARILVDAGISCRQIDTRLSAIGRQVSDIDAVFITHEHSDHVCGLATLAKKRNMPVYCNKLTAQCLKPLMPDFTNYILFDTGATLKYCDVKVETFAVPHDAYDPVGYAFQHKLGRIGFLTDLGYATKLVVDRVKRSRALVLEANYDMGMLHADTKRPWSVKQRIISRHGHLSNEAAAEVAAQVATAGLEDIYLGHLSADCNKPELARQAVQQRLSQDGWLNLTRLHETSPSTACASLVWR